MAVAVALGALHLDRVGLRFYGVASGACDPTQGLSGGMVAPLDEVDVLRRPALRR